MVLYPTTPYKVAHLPLGLLVARPKETTHINPTFSSVVVSHVLFGGGVSICSLLFFYSTGIPILHARLQFFSLLQSLLLHRHQHNKSSHISAEYCEETLLGALLLQALASSSRTTEACSHFDIPYDAFLVGCHLHHSTKPKLTS